MYVTPLRREAAPTSHEKPESTKLVGISVFVPLTHQPAESASSISSAESNVPTSFTSPLVLAVKSEYIGAQLPAEEELSQGGGTTGKTTGPPVRNPPLPGKV